MGVEKAGTRTVVLPRLAGRRVPEEAPGMDTRKLIREIYRKDLGADIL
jgi:hypothetical protein